MSVQNPVTKERIVSEVEEELKELISQLNVMRTKIDRSDDELVELQFKILERMFFLEKVKIADI